MIQVLIWWVIVQVLGWVALPTAMRIFRWLPDRGYAFSKALGVLLVSYFLWIGATFLYKGKVETSAHRRNALHPGIGRMGSGTRLCTL